MNITVSHTVPKKSFRKITMGNNIGLKFVPNLFNSEFEFFYYLLNTIDIQTLELNKKLFFNKINSVRNEENIRAQTIDFEIK